LALYICHVLLAVEDWFCSFECMVCNQRQVGLDLAGVFTGEASWRDHDILDLAWRVFVFFHYDHLSLFVEFDLAVDWHVP
jgi:hypothetical protein